MASKWIKSDFFGMNYGQLWRMTFYTGHSVMFSSLSTQETMKQSNDLLNITDNINTAAFADNTCFKLGFTDTVISKTIQRRNNWTINKKIFIQNVQPVLITITMVYMCHLPISSK